MKCEKCNGSGRTVLFQLPEPCENCGGTGEVAEWQIVNAVINMRETVEAGKIADPADTEGDRTETADIVQKLKNRMLEDQKEYAEAWMKFFKAEAEKKSGEIASQTGKLTASNDEKRTQQLRWTERAAENTLKHFGMPPFEDSQTGKLTDHVTE